MIATETPTFLDIAAPLAARGFRMIPIPAGAKAPVWKAWPSKAQNTPEGLAQLQAEADADTRFKEWNAGCVAHPDNLCLLDCDRPDLVEQIERETGQKLPVTFTVKSGGRGCPHFYFAPTERSRRMKNTSTGDFDFWTFSHQCVAPGSTHSSGRKYEIAVDAPLTPVPDWLCDWMEKQERNFTNGATGSVDATGLAKLKSAYLQDLDPEAMFGLENVEIASGQHPTILHLAGLLHDGERDSDDIAEILKRVWEEYCVGRTVDEGEIQRLVDHTLKGDPCTIEPQNTDVGIWDGMKWFSTEELHQEYLKQARAEKAIMTDAEWFFDADDFLKEKLPPRRALVSDNNGTPLLYEKSLNQVFAYRGQGKTMFTHGLVKLLVHGGEFLRYKSHGGIKVLIADGELPDIQLQERVCKLIGPSGGLLKLMSPDRMPNHIFPSLSNPEWQTEFLAQCDRWNPAVIVFDTLTACFRFDTNDPDMWLQVNQFFITLRMKGYCIIIVHHAGKSGTQRGRTDGDDNLDLSIKLDAPKGSAPGEGLELAVSYEKVRAGGHLPGFNAAYSDVSNVWEIAADTEGNEAIKMMLTGKSVRAVAVNLDIDRNKVYRYRRQAEKNGITFPPVRESKRKSSEEED